MPGRDGRGIRAWYKRAWRWLLGPFTDPHTHLGSSVRIGGHAALYTLCRYVLTSANPNPYIVGSLVTLIIACYGLRAKSTQRSELTMPAPREDRGDYIPPHYVPRESVPIPPASASPSPEMP